MATIHPNLVQLSKLRELFSKHEDLTFAVTSDGIVLVRFLTPWIRDGYHANIGGEIVFVEGQPDHPGVTYVIPSHGRLVGYCKEKPSSERESSLVGTKAVPVPSAAKRLKFKPFDGEAYVKSVAAARKREAKVA